MMTYGYVGYGMGGGLLWMLLFSAIVIIPFWRILPRVGIPAWVSIVAIIPLAALVLLWVVAFKADVSGGSDGA